jgi:hypothetical protein
LIGEVSFAPYCGHPASYKVGKQLHDEFGPEERCTREVDELGRHLAQKRMRCYDGLSNLRSPASLYIFCNQKWNIFAAAEFIILSIFFSSFILVPDILCPRLGNFV